MRRARWRRYWSAWCWASGGSLLATLAEINFLHIAIALFAISTLVLVGVSLVTSPPPAEKTSGLTFATADQPAAGATADLGVSEGSASGRRLDLVLTGLLLACVAAVWLVFA